MTDQITVQLKSGEPFGKPFQTGPVYRSTLYQTSEGQNILRCLRCCMHTEKSKRIPSIFKVESTGSCICLWKLAVAVATYVSICIVYRILPAFAF
jgi:hypothetical protein